MYRRAAAMQVAFALLTTVAGLLAWLADGDPWWLVGTLLLFAVVPLTLLWIKPVNERLMALPQESEVSETETLLRRWAARHAVRSVLSGAAFALFLWRLVA